MIYKVEWYEFTKEGIQKLFVFFENGDKALDFSKTKSNAIVNAYFLEYTYSKEEHLFYE